MVIGVVLVVGLALVLIARGLYDRPAHRYNTTYEACWYAAAVGALSTGATAAQASCNSPSGDLPGVGHLLSTRPYPAGFGHGIVIFITAQEPGRGVEGLAYVKGERPPFDSCVVHLDGPWWQLALENISSMSCPRGFTFQPGA
jgi:hypothetical protein